jgi:multiple sugar transport system permease protein
MPFALYLPWPERAAGGLSRRPYVPRDPDDHPLFVLIREVGLLDTSLGLALAYTSFLLPLFVWIMKGFFVAAPPELEDAARIDGCTRIGAMARVVFPVARNGVLATTVFVAIASWNEFLFALMLTTSSGSRTSPVGLQLMVGEFQLPSGMLSVGGIISTRQSSSSRSFSAA